MMCKLNWSNPIWFIYIHEHIKHILTVHCSFSSKSFIDVIINQISIDAATLSDKCNLYFCACGFIQLIFHSTKYLQNLFTQKIFARKDFDLNFYIIFNITSFLCWNLLINCVYLKVLYTILNGIGPALLW